MTALSTFKLRMRPLWRKFLRYLNRLERDLEKQARARKRTGRNGGVFSPKLGQDAADMPEQDVTWRMGQLSPHQSVRSLYSTQDRFDG